MTKPLEDYVEVAERLERFYEKYPEGSLRCKEIRTVHIGDSDFLVYVAQAFRTPTDDAPAEGSAWEPVPGKTNFTRDSELMNAETSAWGRAIAALGFEVRRGIASRQEVMNRRNGEDEYDGSKGVTSIGFVSDKQKGFFERLLKDAGVTSQGVTTIVRYVAEDLPTERVSKAIDQLKEGDKEKTVAALNAESQKWAGEQTDLPWDEDA